MKIRQLAIENYGVFRNQEFEFDSRLAIVYGPNEAGKSTLLQLIRELLFGFKTSNHPYVFAEHQGELAATAQLEFADGAQLRFRRRKGRKHEVVGELSPSGREIDAQGLSGLLGHAEQSTYEHVFGFSLKELAAADESLKHANLTEALFGGGLGGLANFQSVQRQFKEEADKLYNPRARKGPAINQLQSQIKAVSLQLRDALVKPADYGKLHKQSEACRQEVEDVKAVLREMHSEAGFLERLAGALQPWQQAAAAQRELDTLVVPSGMPSDGAAQLARLKVRKSEIEQELADFEQDLHEAQLELKSLRLAPAVLGHDGDIMQLVRKLEQVEGYRRDIPLRQQESRQKTERVAALLRKLDPSWDFEHLDQFQTSLAQREATAELAQELKELDARLLGLQTTHRIASGQIAEHEQALAAFTAASDIEEVAAVVDQAAAYQRAQEHRQALEQQQAQLTAERTAQLARLNAPLDQPITDSDLAVPQMATIREMRDRLQATEEAVWTAQERLRRAQDDVRETQARAAQLEASGVVPDRDQLIAQRVHRDMGWQLIRRKYIAGEEVSPDEVQPWADEGTLADNFEREVAAADELADQRQAKAELAAQHDQLKQTLARQQQQCETLQDELHQRQQAQEQMELQWQRPWSKCPFEPLSPAAMIDWLGDFEVLRELDQKHAGCVAQHETTQSHIAAFERQLAAAMPDAPGPPSRLLLRAREQVEAARIVAATRRERETQRAKAAAELARIDESLSVTTQQRDAWQARWAKQLRSFGFPPGWTVETANKILTGLHEARGEYEGAKSLDERIAQMQSGVDEFDRQVELLSEAIDPDLRDVPAEHAVTALQEQLEQARQAQRDHEKLTIDCQKRASRVEGKRRQVATTVAEMTTLMTLAEAQTESEFLATARDAERQAELSQTLRQALRDVAALRGDEDEASFASAIQSANADDLAMKQRELSQKIEAMTLRHEAAIQEASVVDASLREMANSDLAADLQIELESLRRQLADQVDQWVPLVLAQSVLKRAVSQFEREHQPAVLAGVQRLFEKMTLGRYVKIERKLDESGTLLVVDQAGQRKEPHQLSTGSREQLYLAIRLAFIEHYCEKHEPLPIVIDDVLVNFDIERARQTMQVLADFQARVQIIFLTCHQHLVDVTRSIVSDCVPVVLPGGELPTVAAATLRGNREPAQP